LLWKEKSILLYCELLLWKEKSILLYCELLLWKEKSILLYCELLLWKEKSILLYCELLLWKEKSIYCTVSRELLVLSTGALIDSRLTGYDFGYILLHAPLIGVMLHALL